MKPAKTSAKDIQFLVKDLKDKLIAAKAAAGPEIVYALQHAGPWWTGNFGRRWELSASPVLPGAPIDRGDGVRTPPGGPPYTIPSPSSRLPEKPASITLSLSRPLYIGNSAAYAGYAVNNPAATLNSPEGPKTYADHAEKFTLTAAGGNPDWYKIYTEGGFLLDDLNQGFRAAGFK